MTTLADTAAGPTHRRDTAATPAYAAQAPPRPDRVPVTTDQYSTFRRDGFIVFRAILTLDEVDELRAHTDDLMQGRLPEQQRANRMSERDVTQDGGVTCQALEAPPDHLSAEEKAQYWLRIHMLHRSLELHERYLLHPRVLDVLEVLIGPDVLAMQTMLFLKPPGKPGQGWHQDSYYIPTHPDTLCGAWIAIDDADEQNGAMWFARGSGVEPVYPPKDGYGFGDVKVESIPYISGASDPDDDRNDLSKVADGYSQVLASARAGDVVFFNGHVLHRSKRNFTTDRTRRSFVSHYCNARSFTQWGADAPRDDVHASHVCDPVTKMTNGSHILARGDTHLPFAPPKFGTPCAATLTAGQRRAQHTHAAAMMGETESGLMGAKSAAPGEDRH